jgi:hypothetical protein
MATNPERKTLEALLWKHTHRNRRLKRANGDKCVLHYEEGHGTCLVPIASLTDEQVLEKLPKSVREQLTEVGKVHAPPLQAERRRGDGD